MSFQAYLDNVRTKTGKTPEDFAKLASRKGVTKHGELVKWLKAEHDLGHGHATAIAGAVLRMGSPQVSRDAKVAALFSGGKAHWRTPCDALVAQVSKFGPDVSAPVGGTYMSLLRANKKFAILQPSAAGRLDIGIKLKGVPASDRYETAGSWNSMVTHRVRIADAKELDTELVGWLRRAYEAAA
jgi:Domain of unknown function (DUF4287)/Domain of unknown function (DUF5655)